MTIVIICCTGNGRPPPPPPPPPPGKSEWPRRPGCPTRLELGHEHPTPVMDAE